MGMETEFREVMDACRAVVDVDGQTHMVRNLEWEAASWLSLAFSMVQDHDPMYASFARLRVIMARPFTGVDKLSIEREAYKDMVIRFVETFISSPKMAKTLELWLMFPMMTLRVYDPEAFKVVEKMDADAVEFCGRFSECEKCRAAADAGGYTHVCAVKKTFEYTYDRFADIVFAVPGLWLRCLEEMDNGEG